MKTKTLDFINNSLIDLTGKTVVVTGANSGLGFAMCKILLMKHAKVVMACRSLKRAEAAKNELIKENPNGEIDIVLYDQADEESIDSFTDQLVEKYPDFYGLILNAGVLKPLTKEVKKDELDPVIKINSVGTIRIIENLQNFLSKSQFDHRIVIQSSITGRGLNKYELSKLLGRRFSRFEGYAISKKILHAAYAYYKEINENDMVVYGLAEPGICNTGILRNFPKWFAKIASIFLNLTCHDNETGCLAALALLNENLIDTYLVPKHLGIKGLPVGKKYKEKYQNDKLIVQILDE